MSLKLYRASTGMMLSQQLTADVGRPHLTDLEWTNMFDHNQFEELKSLKVKMFKNCEKLFRIVNNCLEL